MDFDKDIQDDKLAYNFPFSPVSIISHLRITGQNILAALALHVCADRLVDTAVRFEVHAWLQHCNMQRFGVLRLLLIVIIKVKLNVEGQGWQ